MTTGGLRTVIKACGTVAAVGAVAVAARSYAASAVGGVSATVIAPIAIAKNSDLVLSAPVGSMTKVVVFPGTARTAWRTEGAAWAFTTDTAASLTVSGDTHATYAVTIASMVTAARTDGAGTVTIAAYVISPRGIDLSSRSSQVVLIGGKLPAVPSQARGAYMGNLAVMLEYN